MSRIVDDYIPLPLLLSLSLFAVERACEPRSMLPTYLFVDVIDINTRKKETDETSVSQERHNYLLDVIR